MPFLIAFIPRSFIKAYAKRSTRTPVARVSTRTHRLPGFQPQVSPERDA